MADAKAGATPDDIMSAAGMKPMIAKARQEPVACAVGLTEAKLGVLLLHGKLKPKKLLGELKKSAKDHKLALELPSLRFGTAVVAQDDATLLRLTLNKAPPGGIEAKLRTQIKGSGCAKVEIVVDESLENEPEEDGQGEVGTAGSTASAEPPDAGALARALAALIPQIAKAAGTDKALMARLGGIAAGANAALKGGHPDLAQTGIDELRDALAAVPQAPAAPEAGAVAYGKARLAWLATRTRMTADLAKLRAELQAEYRDEPDGAEILEAYDSRVAPVLAALDERLADKLDEATNATDPAARAALVAEAKGMIGDYQGYLAGETLIHDLDDNPFVPLGIQKLVSATLTALAATVR